MYRSSRFVLLLAGLVLSFSSLASIWDAPTQAEARAEREKCHASKLCRLLIEDKPPALFEGRNDEENCLSHAVKAADLLMKNEGFHPSQFRVLVGVVRTGERHAVLLVKEEGSDWAIDQGGLGYWFKAETPVCPEGVCLAEEAERSFRTIIRYLTLDEARVVDNRQRISRGDPIPETSQGF